MKHFIEGKAYVLGNNIDTDQIIPAQHLSFNPSIPNERKALGQHALSGVPKEYSGLPGGNLPFVNSHLRSQYNIIIAKENFGCGSSREHAPIALAEAGVEGIIASSFARIFYRNCVNGGYLIPFQINSDLTSKINTGDLLKIDVDNETVLKVSSGEIFHLNPLGDIRDILKAGDIFQYARKQRVSAVENV